MAATNTPRAKTERLMNLTMCLLSTRRALPKARIRRMVEAYATTASDEAFDRMFERDKDELRHLGIPLVTEELDGIFEDEQGYRIDQRDYALPDIHLTPDELAVIGLASRAWEHAALASSATTAWQKVAATDLDDDGEAPDHRTEDPFVGIVPNLGGTEPAFPAIRDAVFAGRTVTFDYTRAGEGTAHTRTVDPWDLASWHGRWYLIGYDHDRADSRVYRLSRVGPDVTISDPIAHAKPEDFVAQDAIERFAGTEPSPSPAVLRIRVGSGHTLRRRARTVASIDDDWDLVDVDQGSLAALADEVASHGADVVAEKPDELVDAVRTRLEGVLASLDGGDR